jgi:hypothetical protein
MLDPQLLSQGFGVRLQARFVRAFQLLDPIRREASFFANLLPKVSDLVA